MFFLCEKKKIYLCGAKMAVRLSVNIDKVALLRNSRGGYEPDVRVFAQTCLDAGADGITIHPRPDERHIKAMDVYELHNLLIRNAGKELNIEGYPDTAFIRLVCSVAPQQVTLVPDDTTQLTSDHGWDTIVNQSRLTETVRFLHQRHIRVSIFVDPVEEQVEGAKATGCDRVELYTGPYAHYELPLEQYVACASKAQELGLGVNAGHDLNTQNLQPFVQAIPFLAEVSIGHALICDALYKGIGSTIVNYKNQLTNK